MRRPWTRFTKIGLALWAVTVAAQVAAFAGTYLLYTRHYVITDNAQVDGRSMGITAPVSGTLTQWTVDVGSRLDPDQLIGRIRPQDITTLPGRIVRAPGRGTVAINMAVRGEYVVEGAQLAIAYDLPDDYITARVSEDRIRDVRLGAPVDIVVGGYPRAGLTGVVTEIQSSSAGSFTPYPSPDQNTQNPQKITQYVPVKIRYFDTGAALMPGMNVTVHIHIP